MKIEIVKCKAKIDRKIKFEDAKKAMAAELPPGTKAAFTEHSQNGERWIVAEID